MNKPSISDLKVSIDQYAEWIAQRILNIGEQASAVWRTFPDDLDTLRLLETEHLLLVQQFETVVRVLGREARCAAEAELDAYKQQPAGAGLPA